MPSAQRLYAPPSKPCKQHISNHPLERFDRMEKQNSELLERLRQQYEKAPYPRFPLDKLPTDDPALLFKHYLANAYYLRNQSIPSSEGKIILDAGCGSGYKALMLAHCNPGAKIIGVDLSEKSTHLAKERLNYHGFSNAEFYSLSIEELASLGRQFDYINCDDVLYILPDRIAALRAMKSVLKPEGIIRANLHSSLQRSPYFRAQEVFARMALMDGNPRELEIEIVRETMKALKDDVQLKMVAWNETFEASEEPILVNYLLIGDRGFTIPEMFSILEETGLEFIDMLDWRTWQLETLFREPDNLPLFLGLSIPGLSRSEELALFELLQPNHRLLDFCCGHPGQAQTFLPVDEWSQTTWQHAQVRLHPHLKTAALEAALIGSAVRLEMLIISDYLPISQGSVAIDSAAAAALLPLIEGPQTVNAMVDRWLKLQPLNPIALTPYQPQDILEILIQTLTNLERSGYIFLENKL